MTLGEKTIRTTILVKESDFKFCQQRGLKFSRVLRGKIEELRDYEEGEVDFKYANARLQKIIEKQRNITDYLISRLPPSEKAEIDDLIKKGKI